MLRRHLLTAFTPVLALTVGLVTTTVPAQAASVPHGNPVNVAPAAGTPMVASGRVYAIAEVPTSAGPVMVIGGTFTSVLSPDRATTYARTYVAAFNPTTGAVTAFAPSLNGHVEQLLPGPTLGTVYVGGRFGTVGGVATKGLVLLDVATGARVTTFKPPVLNGIVMGLRRISGRLYVGGTFTKVGTTARGGLATLNASTGALDPFLSSSVSVNHNWTATNGAARAPVGITRLDVTADGKRLVVIGNFKKVDDLDRDQVAMWDLSGTTAVVRTDWRTRGFEAACYSSAFDSYVRDLSISPDGTYFTVASTGGGTSGLCDTVARFEMAAAGDDVKPTWAAYAGGDSLLSVASVGPVVYTGGHQRWMNNPNGNDRPGPGAVPRPGLAALDARTGVPIAWNPGRNPRGSGAWALLATPTGLWMGSDTDFVGNRKFRRQKIAFFPLAAGRPLASETLPTWPGGLYLGTRPSAAASGVYHRVNAGGPGVQSTDSGPDWRADNGADFPYRNSGSHSAGWAPVPTVDATVPASTPRSLFDSERWDSGGLPELAWSFPVPAGESVKVRLYFANRCGCTSGVGQRVFNVGIDGTDVLTSFDIVAAVGDQVGTMREFPVTSDGLVDIDLTHVTENPLVNGIEIVSQDVPPAAVGTMTRSSVASDGTTVSAATAAPASAPNPTSMRGATMIGGSLFYGKNDSNFYKRTYNGTTFGAETLIDPYNDALWSTVDTGSGQTFRGTKPDLYSQFPNVTSMFYGGGRLYYTLYQDTKLRYRSFSPDSGIVHPNAVETGAVLPDITGATLVGNVLYYVSRADGVLSKVGFADGALTGTPEAVSGPGLDGRDWRGQVLFAAP